MSGTIHFKALHVTLSPLIYWAIGHGFPLELQTYILYKMKVSFIRLLQLPLLASVAPWEAMTHSLGTTILIQLLNQLLNTAT